MKRQFVVLSFSLLFLALAHSVAAQERPGHYAGESVFRASFGIFSPDGKSTYWEDKEAEFNGSVDDFDDATLSLDYIYFVSPRIGLMGSFGGWEGKSTQSYRDFVDDLGGEISHLTTVEENWLDFGVVFNILPKRAAVMPYLGAGATFISWKLVEEGDFIDFGTGDVVRTGFRSSGDAFGFFLLAGLEVPVSDWVSLFAEGRWRSADDELSRDFAGLGTFDLSGVSVTGGVAVTF